MDDFLRSGDDDFINEVIGQLRKKYSFKKVSTTDFTFLGLHIFQNEDCEIFVENFASKMEIFDYVKQENTNMLNKSENTQIRKLQDN